MKHHIAMKIRTFMITLVFIFPIIILAQENTNQKNIEFTNKQNKIIEDAIDLSMKQIEKSQEIIFDTAKKYHKVSNTSTSRVEGLKKVEEIKKERDLLMKEVLSKNQFKTYSILVENGKLDFSKFDQSVTKENTSNNNRFKTKPN